MTHPRLAVSEMCTYRWTFAEELTLWDELGIRQVGLLLNKIEDHGRDAVAAALKERAAVATTVITRNFDLAAPETWDATRATLDRAIDIAAEFGGCPYFTPGRPDGRTFDELAAALAQAVAPCAAYAESRGVRLAIEPTLRADQSFVHTLREAIAVADRAGIGLIADLGNSWPEDGVEDTVRRAGSRIAVVQLCDVVTGTAEPPPPGDRAVPGDGDLDLTRFVAAALDAGYTGAFELELVGPRIEAEGHASATRRAVERANTLLERVLP